MSIINKMLQDLDRRHARSAPPGQSLHPVVRAVRGARTTGEWFWRTVAALMLVAAAWTLWVVYQLQPRSFATELAERAAENSRRRAVAAPAPHQPAAMTKLAAAPGAGAQPLPVEAAAQPAPEKLTAPIEMLRLALTIDTPLAPRAQPRSTPAVEEKRAPRLASAPKPRAELAPPAPPTHIEKRERDRSPTDRAENHFRRAAQMLERGRVADAEDALLAALNADSAHQAARQTLVALYIEQGRIDDARRHLQEGLAFNPGYAPFAVALARIHVDRGDFSPALAVLEQATAAGRGNPDYHALHGAVLQRLGRHGAAADAYRLALTSAPQSGATWVGLAISLEAQGHLPEAAEAYRRGVASGTLTGDVRAYADQRARQLK
jgi:MSHA biogenesis protein MshN